MNIQTLFKQAPATAMLLASFILLFVLQILTGTDISNPSTQSLVTWGANFLPLTLGDQPWRLVSSAFLHIGLMHLLFNGFAMYYFGQVAEMMLGSVKLTLLFLLSAIGGNLLNSYDTIYWQLLTDGNVSVSAGASGGIMGIGMSLLTVELLRHTILKMPNQGIRDKAQLRSLAIIMGINLMYGFAVPGIDNAGHIGGAITGAILTLGVVFGYRYSTRFQNMLGRILPWLIFVIVGIIFYGLWLYLHYQL